MKKTFTLLLFSITVGLLIISCTNPGQNKPQTNFDKELAWWKDAKFGMFIHWGISTLEGFEISWSRSSYGPEKYDRLAQRFNPVDFDADKWISVAENTGMKYMVLTAKHHDGYCLWDSKVNSHNIMNSPYGKDVCAQLAEAAHRRGMRLGWYFSVNEWNDSTCNHKTLNHLYMEKMKGELKELLTNYGKIDLLWFDYEGNPAAADPQSIFDYCRELQPDIIINNRLYPLHPNESHAYVGSMGMYATPEQFIGGYGDVPWESCTLSATAGWSISYWAQPHPSKNLIWQVAGSVGGNGNLLMNVSPDSLGVIHENFIDTLKLVGKWIKQNDGAIYGTKGGPWKPTVSYVSTRKDKTVNLILQEGSDIALPYSSEIDFDKAYLLSNGEDVKTRISEDTIFFSIPESAKGASNVVIRLDMKSEADKIALIPPFSTSGSLAYNKKIKASSSLSDIYMHNPECANDDDPRTRWILGRRKDYDSSSVYGHNIHFTSNEGIAIYDDCGELEVDLEEDKEVSSFKVIPASNIANAYIEYEHNSKWKTAASYTQLANGSEWETTFSTPIKARKWRLRISGGSSQTGIKEFQLF